MLDVGLLKCNRKKRVKLCVILEAFALIEDSLKKIVKYGVH